MELALLRVDPSRRPQTLCPSPSRAQAFVSMLFDVSTKMMTTVHERGDHFLFAVKGAPEAVLAASDRVLSHAGDAPHRIRLYGANG